MESIYSNGVTENYGAENRKNH